MLEIGPNVWHKTSEEEAQPLGCNFNMIFNISFAQDFSDWQ